MRKSKYAVDVEIVLSIVVETDKGPDHAAEIVAGPDFNLGGEIEQKIIDGCYDVRAIETEGRVP